MVLPSESTSVVESQAHVVFHVMSCVLIHTFIGMDLLLQVIRDVLANQMDILSRIWADEAKTTENARQPTKQTETDSRTRGR